jgi:hypothetical protein
MNTEEENHHGDAPSTTASSLSHLPPSSSRDVPLSAANNNNNMSPRNPFYERERNNFPDFEIALKPGSPSSYYANTFDDDDEADDDDQRQHSSVCSGGNSSILNMSIGARAALNEHLRHIAKHGIDGESGNSGNNHDDDDNLGNAESPPPSDSHNNPLDEHWENLLDISNRVNSSGEAGSFAGGALAAAAAAATIPSPFGDSSPLNHLMYAASSEADGDGIEVMTDVSHDYFNSSRVKLLATPERNLHRRLDMVVTRDDEPVDAPSFGDSSFIHDEPSSFEAMTQDRIITPDLLPDSAFPNIHDSGISHSSQHHSMDADHSFNPGDISEVRRSPDISFLSQDHHHHFDLDVNPLNPPADAVDTFPLETRDTSVLSAPLEKGIPLPAQTIQEDLLQKSFPLTSPSAISQRRSPRRRGSRLHSAAAAQQKENVSPEISSSSGSTSHSKNTGSSLHSVVSSFIEEAKSVAMYMASELEQSFGGLESLPGDFLRVMDLSGGGTGTGTGTRNDPPSPISQVESNNSSSHGSTKAMAKERTSQSTVLGTNETTLTGRQRFRTVVPRRIYQSRATNRLEEEEQDSFLAIRSNPETRRRGVDISLLDSFDVAATRTTF